MKSTLLIIFALVSFVAKGQEEFEAFNYLSELKFNNSSSIFFDKKNAVVINKQRKDISKGQPFYCQHPEDLDGQTYVLVKLTFNKNANVEYTILYNEGSSINPEFSIYNDELHLGDITGWNLFITKSGNFYSSGHVNSEFNVRRKFQIKDGKLIEVKQPFLYVGLKSITLKGINLYETKELKNKIAFLPTDYEVEVVLADSEIEGLYLLKTKFGLVGWTKIESSYPFAKTIKDLRYID
ncbi:hypothetical protein [Carboxylicivirga sp. M1479]|uniref:hypothetical protein n=1 Tax=Carboxylicivirga sp. M1479 TaxID=2594476 RepID=UPI0011778E32|nr:hypothetical protein [Carboxylicivirga sp. M1479]TRX61664.1 hypothetical protein FNN09_20120 [Carboxylicivirga sp. M1479]